MVRDKVQGDLSSEQDQTKSEVWSSRAQRLRVTGLGRSEVRGWNRVESKKYIDNGGSKKEGRIGLTRWLTRYLN